ncbi:MAG: hypothetical protein P8181_09995, partial [bacterium]
MSVLRRTIHTAAAVVGLVILLGTACTSPVADTDTPPKTVPTGCTDGECPLGEECDGVSCVPVRPTLYPHIQLASCLLRPYNDDSEILWRATHADLLIGHVGECADEIRAENPNARLFEYAMFRYYYYPRDAEAWAAEHGVSTEDFFLHYREDVEPPGFESIVLVPGFPPGFAPGWNPDRVPDDPPASASERSQSRSVGVMGPSKPWYVTNIVNPDYRAFLTDLLYRALIGERS